MAFSSTFPSYCSSTEFTFLISTTACAADLPRYVGSADYSYAFVMRALAPVLDALGGWARIPVPESSLAFAAERAIAEGKRPVHLAIHPPQNLYLTPAVPTVIFPFWEFPDVPSRDFRMDTRQNWTRMCRRVDMLLTACEFTARGFRRAGLSCPIEVTPVPVSPAAFDVPAWDAGWNWTLPCRHLVWGGGEGATHAPGTIAPPASTSGLRAQYRRHIRPWLSDLGANRLGKFKRALLRQPEAPPPLLPATTLRLSGLVYTSIFNLSDRRKNAEDLLTAFLSAFRDRDHVTLVLKLATSPSRELFELLELRALYKRIGMPHRCRIVVITDYLSDAQMNDLLRATTYYVNTSHAEGACLPLQQALAAGRPAIAPRHTAMADYLDDSVGFVIESHPEPTFWPHDPDLRYETTWHRLVWDDIRSSLLRSAELVERDRAAYDAMASASRNRMRNYASQTVVVDGFRRALARLPESPIGGFSWVA
jgi:glycosyltransferase involved in cell wall biosynthesis